MELLRLKADFDKCPDAFVATPETLSEAWFCDTPVAHVLVAEEEGRLIGIATYYVTFSTFLGKKALWLDDLYVVEGRRSHGAGSAIFTRLACIAKEQNLSRIDWTAASTNIRGINFYEKHGARLGAGTRLLRLDQASILALSQSSG
jgi:GNAT superfamily N-acetyltransferase